jgi:hypothetical protein
MYGCAPGERPARPTVGPIRLRSGDEVWIRDCPRQIRDEHPWIGRLFRVHSHWTASRYWHGADLGAWPARDLLAMEILDQEVGDWREEQRKRREREEAQRKGK